MSMRRRGLRRTLAAALRPRALAAGTLAAGALAACGPLPPQAPFRQAQRLDSATGGIAFACGEAFQITAFPGDHARDLAPVRALAVRRARRLAAVDARNPDWIYQGQTVAEIVANGVTDLRSCGLGDAARVLQRAARR
jgi:hypothetical protein